MKKLIALFALFALPLVSCDKDESIFSGGLEEHVIEIANYTEYETDAIPECHITHYFEGVVVNGGLWTTIPRVGIDPYDGMRIWQEKDGKWVKEIAISIPIQDCENMGGGKFKIFLPGKIDKDVLTKIADKPGITSTVKNAKWSVLSIEMRIPSEMSDDLYADVYLTDNPDPAKDEGEYSYASFVYCDTNTTVSGEYSRVLYTESLEEISSSVAYENVTLKKGWNIVSFRWTSDNKLIYSSRVPDGARWRICE